MKPPPPRKPPDDPQLDVENLRGTTIHKGLPKLPPAPRPREATPLSPMTPRPPSSAVGVPSSGLPVPQPPRSWRFPDEETKTPTGTMDRRMLAAVVASFHPLSTQHRLDLAEIGSIFADMEEVGGRERLLALVRAYGNSSAGTRVELLEAVLLLSEMTAADRARLIRIARALPDPPELDVPVTVVE